MAMYQKREKKKGTKGSIYEQGINSKIAVFFFPLLLLQLNSLPLLIVAFQGFIKTTWSKALSFEKQSLCVYFRCLALL